MFENKIIKDYAHASRFVASWTNKGGKLDRENRQLFKKWLRSLGLEEEDVTYIYNFATNGKLELEGCAMMFLMGQQS